MHRVLYLSRGGDMGGSQRQLLHVLTNLDRRRYEPIVVCRSTGAFVEALRQADIETHILPLRPWRAFLSGMWRFADTRRLTRFAVAHDVSLMHSSDLWLSKYLTCTARRIGVPSVLHVRTPLPSACVAKHGCGEADALIAISRRVRNDLLLGGIRHEKIALIGDSVDIDQFHPSVSARNILRRQFAQSRGLLIGLVGRIEPFKRQLDFLRAAAHIVRANGPAVTFFLVGKVHCPRYNEEVLDFIRDNGLADRVVLTGPRDDMPEVLGSLDILVSLSGGSVMFEAMSCGKPVLSAGFSTKTNAVHVQDGRTGLLVTSKQNEDLVQAMLRLISNADLRRYLGQTARIWAEDNFSHVSMAMKTQMLYDKLLAHDATQYRTASAAAGRSMPAAAEMVSAASAR
ncbi:MAG: glycosyltransferase family 4 protein [Phycisphaerae bacterium]|nr:glycosyltransferase family 4 protein [Phycisphaerae bacterium]